MDPRSSCLISWIRHSLCCADGCIDICCICLSESNTRGSRLIRMAVLEFDDLFHPRSFFISVARSAQLGDHMCDAARETPLPTLLVLEHHDSYTRNILSMYSDLPGSSRSSPCGNNEDPDQRIIWQCENWKDRIVIVNVDDITW